MANAMFTMVEYGAASGENGKQVALMLEEKNRLMKSLQ